MGHVNPVYTDTVTNCFIGIVALLHEAKHQTIEINGLVQLI